MMLPCNDSSRCCAALSLLALTPSVSKRCHQCSRLPVALASFWSWLGGCCWLWCCTTCAPIRCGTVITASQGGRAQAMSPRAARSSEQGHQSPAQP